MTKHSRYTVSRNCGLEDYWQDESAVALAQIMGDPSDRTELMLSEPGSGCGLAPHSIDDGDYVLRVRRA